MVINYVFYIPELKNNLLSISQLQGRNLPIERGLIAQTQMSTKRMFILRTSLTIQASPLTCFQTTSHHLVDLLHHSLDI